jgi:hypothetical protein
VTTWAASRRTALAGSVAAVAGGLLAACDATSSPSGPAGSGPATSAAEDPDAGLVDEAAAGTRQALALLVALPHRDREAVGGLRELHRAHLGALDAPARPAGHPARPTLAEVRRAESALQRRLAHLAARAESGPLARLLASMSAGIAAHLAANLAADATPHRASS